MSIKPTDLDPYMTHSGHTAEALELAGERKPVAEKKPVDTGAVRGAPAEPAATAQ